MNSSAVAAEYCTSERHEINHAASVRLPRCPEFEVDVSVVASNAVLVMNGLTGKKAPAKALLHDQAMHELALSPSVNVTAYVASLVGVVMARPLRDSGLPAQMFLPMRTAQPVTRYGPEASSAAAGCSHGVSMP